MCSGPCARRAKDSMACLRQSSVGRIPVKTNKLSIGVRCRLPLLMRKVPLIGLLIRRVWALQHQTDEQYFAAECTKARRLVCNVGVPASQVNFWCSDSRCRRNASTLSNFIPRYVGSAQSGRGRPSTLMESLRHASLLLRWKAADTVWAVGLLSLSFYFWRYEDIVASS